MKLLYVLLMGLLWPFGVVAQTDMLPPALAHAPDTTKTWTLRHLGDSLINAGQLTTAQQAFRQALTIAETAGSVGDLGLCSRWLGYWYESTGDYNQAVAWYQKALLLFGQTSNQRQYIKTLNMISFDFDRLHDDQRAYQYAMRSLTLAQQGGYADLAVAAYETLASWESHRKHYGRAIAYNQKALDHYRRRNDWVSYHTALFNAGLHYKNMGQYVRSERVFRQVLAYADKTNDELMRGYVEASLPYALIPQHKLDEAEQHARLALAWVERTGTAKFSMAEDINGHLSRISEQRGDNKQALLFYKRQMANHDSVFNETKNRQIAELETRYQTRQKEDQIKLLDVANAQQKRQIGAGVGGLALLSLLLGTMVWQYRRIRRSRTKIQQQSNQLALMMKELHHRVKNNLAIVSSLLKLQSSRLEDEKAVAAVRTGQQRVEAMSLIHQRLYQTDRVSSVNIREYLTDLAESLMQAYGYDRRDFDLVIDVEQQELDVDVAMPLGLIANELITNAFKYAYLGENRPLLRIGLHSQNGRLTLYVQDNGPGVDESDWQQQGSRASFGKRLIASLSEQLDGQFELTKQNGTLFRLHIPHNRLQPAG